MEKLSGEAKQNYERVFHGQPNNVKYIANFSILKGATVLTLGRENGILIL
jgi:hypothetical protein